MRTQPHSRAKTRPSSYATQRLEASTDRPLVLCIVAGTVAKDAPLPVSYQRCPRGKPVTVCLYGSLRSSTQSCPYFIFQAFWTNMKAFGKKTTIKIGINHHLVQVSDQIRASCACFLPFFSVPASMLKSLRRNLLQMMFLRQFRPICISVRWHRSR